jgi:hypothetical protein
MDPSENPYASPTADLTAPFSNDPKLSDAEVIRKKHISHEASLQSVGWLCWLGCIFLALAALGMTAAIFTQRGGSSIGLVIALIYLALFVLNAWLGYGFRKLDPRVRIPGGILFGLGLLYIPIGTIINGYILYLMFSAKGRMVFSPEYKEIIRQTPHIKYRTSIIVWILLVIVLAFLALAIGAAIFSGMRAGRGGGAF